MKCIVAIFLLAATAVFAQEPAAREAIPNPLPIAAACSVTVTDLEGVIDNFAQPPDPTTQSPALQAYLASVGGPQSQYDTTGCDKKFGGSWRLCTCETCGARLEVRVRRCGSSLDNNDGYHVGVAPFGPGRSAASGAVWQAGDPTEKTLVINLTRDQLKVLCANKAQFLDLYIQDDTIVDWARLTIQQP